MRKRVAMGFSKEDAWKLAVSILICEAAGLIGSVFTISSIPTWYSSLVKPSFSPPNWVFGPVWTLLYALMGISAYWIYKNAGKSAKSALTVFSIQLLLNVLWSVAFFGVHSPPLGMLVILLLWCSIAWTMLAFYRIDRKAGLILVPYLVWVSFASLLNYQILLLN